MNKYGLIGYPLGHSFSKKYFTEKFEKENITDCQFDLYEIEEVNSLKEVLSENTELKGMSVTIPHKETVIDLLDELDDTAKSIGAVNSIRIRYNDGKFHLKGYNTDCLGFEASLKPHLKENHKKALILGTGGAAKAVDYILNRLGIKTVYVSRTPKDGQFSYSELDKSIIEEYTLIVNSSPLGTHPNIDSKPDIPYEFLSQEHIIFDLVYNPLETAFMKEGTKYGATVINGLEMLHQQAEKSWSIWNDL